MYVLRIQADSTGGGRVAPPFIVYALYILILLGGETSMHKYAHRRETSTNITTPEGEISMHKSHESLGN
jgi:hypothetical protein